VHGLSGVDEVVGDAPTLLYLFDERGALLQRVEPSDFGIKSAATPLGGSVASAQRAFTEILAGAPGPAADVVAMNAAVVFHAIGVEAKLAPAFERARTLLAGGNAWPIFERARERAKRG